MVSTGENRRIKGDAIQTGIEEDGLRRKSVGKAIRNVPRIYEPRHHCATSESIIKYDTNENKYQQGHLWKQRS